MSQSASILFYLAAGFLIFVTIKGELPKYAAVVGLTKQSFQYGAN